VTDLELRLVRWGENVENVRAMAIVGSQARVEVPSDEWSDVDVVIFASEPAKLLESEDWVGEFGTVRLTFLEDTAVGGERERRALYEDGTDIDFSVVPFQAMDHPAVGQVAARGVHVLLDKDGELERRLAQIPPPSRPPLPDEHELRELVSDFFYHAVWAARKLRRGEIFTAKRCVDSYLENVVIRIVEWRTRAEDPDVDTWYAGRFIERWADPAAVEEFRLTFARYDEADVRRALFATMDFFRRQAHETADLLGLAYPAAEDEFTTGLVRRILD
jgi:aminoglycoside 6-adenylyltransferase